MVDFKKSLNKKDPDSDLNEEIDSFLSKVTPQESEERPTPEIKYKTVLSSELNEQQKYAKDLIKHWFLNTTYPRVKIGGYAGTGKTTLIKHVLNELREARPNLKVKVGAYTGKAVSVLLQKGLLDSETVHSMIYHIKDDQPGNLTFEKRSKVFCDLFVIDEASMIPGSIDSDLGSYNKRILYIGDPGQLKPVDAEDDIGLMDKPNYVLDEIHRQAKNSNIIDFAWKVRNGLRIFRNENHSDLVVRESHHFEDAAKHAEMVIVGFNKTRHYMNTLLRKHNKFEDALPEPGEKLICLMNNKERGMYNGMSVRVLNRKDQYKTTLYLDLVDDLGNLYEDVATHIPQYGVNSLRATHRSRDVLLFDWNYAQTAHKSQGSEYKHVAVLEEIVREWDECRWRYTVATRASELLEYYK